jgi:hypothetical protein
MRHKEMIVNHESGDMQKGAAVAYFKGTIPASTGRDWGKV